MVPWTKKFAPGVSSSDEVAADQFNQLIDYITDIDIGLVSTTIEPSVKTNTRFRDEKLRIWGSLNNGFAYRFKAGAILASYRVILPLLTADDTLLFQNLAQSIAGKSIDVDTNTIFDTGADEGGILAFNGTRYVDFPTGANHTVLTSTGADNPLLYKLLTDDNIATGADIAWDKVDKTGSSIDDTDDVILSDPQLNDALIFDGTKWTNAVISLGTEEGEANTASNVGTAGVGVFKGKVGFDLRFKKIASVNSVLSVIDNTDDDQVDLELEPDSITDTYINSAAAIAWSKISKTGSLLDDFGNVVLTSPAIGEVLTYNGTNWVNDDVAASGETNTASNVGTAGVGVFKQKTGVNLEFKKINSSNLTITDDTGNSEVDVIIPSGAITNTLVSNSAAIAYSKLALTGNIINTDISASAAIDYSKLELTGEILNADIAAAAAIVYSKLNLSNSIVAGDLTSNAVTTAKILDANVTTAKIADLNVTAAKAAADFRESYLPRHKFKSFFGHSLGAGTSGSGFWHGLVTSAGAYDVQTSAGGVEGEWTTGAASGDSAGFRINDGFCRRQHNVVIRFGFHLVTATSTKGFIGFVDDDTAFQLFPDPLNADEGIGLYWDSTTQANFRIANNDGAGATITNNLSTSHALDTLYHTVSIVGDETNSRFQFYFDNYAVSNVSTEIPAATTGLAFNAHIETATTAARVLTLTYCEGETIRPT